MATVTKKALSVTTSALMLTSMGAGAAVLVNQSAEAAPVVSVEANNAQMVSQNVMPDKVEGVFAYSQTETATVDGVRNALSNASQYLCAGAPVVTGDIDTTNWEIEINGMVKNSYVTTVGELQKDDKLISQTLGCACAGNPADGAAAVNAEVTGVAMTTLLNRAGVEAGANTVVLTSADGYRVALPLMYVKTHYCPIVFNVAGAPIAESIGGANQLWLGSTSANYFARDIVSITVEARDEVPANPGTAEAADSYANLPNIGIAYGGTIS